ncbi:zinc finger, C6HC-type containing protein, partial [Tanacetum coccineum]
IRHGRGAQNATFMSKEPLVVNTLLAGVDISFVICVETCGMELKIIISFNFAYANVSKQQKMKRKRERNNDLNIANHDQEGSTSSMDDSSISHPYIIVDIDDDPYFPPLVSRDPISNQKYAEQLQLHEALVLSSASRASSSKTPIVILDGQDLKPYESSQVADRFSDICMDTKTESEMFRNSKVCGHMCPDPNCKGVIGPEACRLIVPKEVLERWENALCESLVLGTQKFYCPFKDCSALLHYKKKENGRRNNPWRHMSPGKTR